MKKLYLIFMFAVVAITGCASPPILIQKDDPTYLRAQRRLQRTLVLVDGMKVSPAERTMFMQAESFYRYRFEQPPRSNKTLFTEVLAAATDFPLFQSLASSFDLFNLRVRAPDAAVQIWESFLKRYPNSKLQPLVLYRLGWALRSVGVTGFKHTNPNDAFNELIHEDPKSQLAVYAHEAEKVPWRSKRVADARSLIPGLGQFYVGDDKGGAIRLAAAILGALAIAYPTYVGIKNQNVTWADATLGLGGLILLSFDYTNAYENAQWGVLKWNERAEKEFDAAHPNAP